MMAHSSSRASRIGEAALWTGACMIVLTAHLAGAAVLLRQDPAEAGNAAPPAAIMIELAPEPEAAAVDETVASDQNQDSEEVKSEAVEPVREPEPQPQPDPVPQPVPDPPQETAEAPPEPEPEPIVEEKPPEQPVQETTQTIPEPVPEPTPEPVVPDVAQSLALLDNVEVPLPMARPKAVEPPKEDRKPDPAPKKVTERAKPKPPAPAAKAATQAKAEVKQSDRTAAPAASDSAPSNAATNRRWQAKVAAILARQRSKCRDTGSRGMTAYVAFQVDGGGSLRNVSLARSSGSGDLDRCMVDVVRGVSSVPPPPAGISSRVLVPLGY